jgi:hypothetical protein
MWTGLGSDPAMSYMLSTMNDEEEDDKEDEDDDNVDGSPPWDNFLVSAFDSFSLSDEELSSYNKI